jgi:hypothetical protein
MSMKQLSCMVLHCATWWLIFVEACNHVIWYDRSCLHLAGEIRIQGYIFISWPFIKISSFAIRTHITLFIWL